MRTKAHRYGMSASGTFTNGTDVVGVTGDFEGGFIQANAFVYGIPGAGQQMSAAFKIDGVTQGFGLAMTQSGSSLGFVHTTTLRIPQGRHRVSVYFTSSVAPLASCTADLNVAELNA